MNRRVVQLPHCTAGEFVPTVIDSDRHVLYLHGGGFYVGGHYLHRQMAASFARELAAPLLHVDYRQFPRNSVADAVQDCLDGYRHLLGRGIDASRIVVMGDSAGGYLSLASVLAARDAGMPMPGAIVAMSPLTDWDYTDKLAAPSSRTCSVFPPSSALALAKAAQRYNRGVDPISPARANLRGLPPTLIQASRSEIVYPDAATLAEQLTAHSVRCELQTWERQVHVFQAAATIVPEAAHAVANIVEFIDRTVTRQVHSNAS